MWLQRTEPGSTYPSIHLSTCPSIHPPTHHPSIIHPSFIHLSILPSSIHEVIAIPAAMERGGMANLAEEVRSINMGELELEERLSNSVYHYDRTARKVTLASESPEKRLDGKQAELPLIQEDKRQR